MTAMDPTDAQLLMLSIGIGLVVSLLFAETFGITAGGMIVPGYLALYLNRPLDVFLTLLVALLTFAVVRVLSSVAVVFGRRRTVLTILTGYLIGTVFRFGLTGAMLPGSDADLIGFIIPGLIAIWLERQGIVDTLAGLITGSVLVRLILILVLAG